MRHPHGTTKNEKGENSTGFMWVPVHFVILVELQKMKREKSDRVYKHFGDSGLQFREPGYQNIKKHQVYTYLFYNFRQPFWEPGSRNIK